MNQCFVLQEFMLMKALNASLAFFIQDCFSLMNRGFVFSMIKNYCKNVSVRNQTPLPNPRPSTKKGFHTSGNYSGLSKGLMESRLVVVKDPGGSCVGGGGHLCGM